MKRALVLLLFAASAAAQNEPARAILAAFDKYDVVLLSEEHYGVQFHGMLRQLVSDSRLIGRFNDIVVECGNPRYQDVVDRYIAGDDVSLTEVRKAWRNTSQILAWDSPLYESLYTWIRTVNSGLKPEQRYRLVLMEPAIDWTKVKTAADYKPYAQRSRDQLARVESEVIAKHRKAIIVVGGAHVVRRSMRSPKEIVPIENASLGDALGRKYPGRTYAVWTVPGSATLSAEFAGSSLPAIAPVAGTPFESRSFGDAAPDGMMVQRTINGKQEWVKLTSADWPAISDMADALLFLGTVRTKAEPPKSVYKDDVYYREVLRRAKIMSEVFGFDMTEEVREAAGREAH
jgi:hypothetical protein